MTRPIRIMVACGSGIATSVHVSMTIKDKLADRGVPCDVNECSVTELQDRAGGYDLIVSTAQVAFQTEQPVLNGVPLLMGVGVDGVIDEIVEHAQQLEKRD